MQDTSGKDGATAREGPSRRDRITNVVATSVAIAGAIVASPVAVAQLPAGIVAVLRTAVTLGNTLQPLVVSVAGILVAAVTHPPKWLRHG